MIKGSVPGRGKKGSGAHPTSYSIGSRVKAAGSWHCTAFSVEVNNEWSYTSTRMCLLAFTSASFIIIIIIIILMILTDTNRLTCIDLIDLFISPHVQILL